MLLVGVYQRLFCINTMLNIKKRRIKPLFSYHTA